MSKEIHAKADAITPVVKIIQHGLTAYTNNIQELSSQSCTFPYLEILTGLWKDWLLTQEAAETSAPTANFAELSVIQKKRLKQGVTASQGIIDFTEVKFEEISGIKLINIPSETTETFWGTEIQMLSAGGWSQYCASSNSPSISSIFTHIEKVHLSFQDQIICLQGTITFYFFRQA